MRCTRRFSSYYTFTNRANQSFRVDLSKIPSYVGLYSSRGMRPYNEDRYFAGVLDLPAMSSFVPHKMRGNTKSSTRKVFNFAVFDGHGGAQCSEYLVRTLAKQVENFSLEKGTEAINGLRNEFGGYWRNWRDGEIHKYMRSMTDSDDFQLRLPLAFLTTDYDYVSRALHKDIEDNVSDFTSTTHAPIGGSTCTSIYIYSKDADTDPDFWEPSVRSRLVSAHVGDTRALLVDRYGQSQPLTPVHHPSSPVEAERLRKFNAAFVTDSFGEERFGNFANTRAFGDVSAKSRGVSAEPDIVERDISPDHAFIVMVSDGVTSKVSDEEIVDLVIATQSGRGSGRGSPQESAKEIVEYAEAVGTDDNSTALVIRLPGWGKWEWTDSTAQQREDRLTEDSRHHRSLM